MNPKFQIGRGEWFCPACGRKGTVQEEDHRITIEKENFFSELKTDTSETSSDWFPDLNLVSKKHQYTNRILVKSVRNVIIY